MGLPLVMSATAGHAADNQTPHRNPPAAADLPQRPGGSWCADHRLGRLTEQQRLEDGNLNRLRAAQVELAPGFTAGRATTGLHLLAAYQEEVEKARPDASLAATYLAQASAVPITAGRIQRVNALLCVSSARALAQKIETEAEAQRRQMAR